MTDLDRSEVFIVGCPRSGTSWLFNMIKRHPQALAVPSETHAYSLIYDPFRYLPDWSFQRRLQTPVQIVREYGLKAFLLGVGADDIWRSIPKKYRIYQQGKSAVGLHNLADYQTLHACLQQVRGQDLDDLSRAENLIAALFDQFFIAANGQSGQTIVEKTPLHIRYVDKILRRFPQAKIVEIVRDGRDVDVSHRARGKTQKWARRDTEGMVRLWRRCIQLGEKFRGNPEFADRIYLARYEDLRADPGENLGQILEFLGWPYTPELQQEIVAANDIQNVQRKGEGLHVRKGAVGEWRDALTPEEQAIWRTQVGPLLEQLGYG